MTKQKKNYAPLLFLIIIAIAVLASTPGCSRNGYGCHGTSKIMTRVR